MLATPGAITSIENSPVRVAAREFLFDIEYESGLVSSAASKMVQLSLRFPNVLPVKLTSSDMDFEFFFNSTDGATAVTECDLK